MNAILDGYPDDFEGYLIRTDFRIGMQICMCLSDRDMEEPERLSIALELLYGRNIPDIDTAMKGLSWYLNAGREPEQRCNSDDDGEERNEEFSFEVDSDRIISAFMRAYNIDLTKTHMHWFRFLTLLGDVGECAFTNVINIRTQKLTSAMSPEYRASISALKRKYSLRTYSNEEQEKINEFFAQLTGNS